mgnify:CR=1 FL=1
MIKRIISSENLESSGRDGSFHHIGKFCTKSIGINDRAIALEDARSRVASAGDECLKRLGAFVAEGK